MLSIILAITIKITIISILNNLHYTCMQNKPTTSVTQSEGLPRSWINFMSRTWMMGRQLGAVSPSGRVNYIWRTTQVTLKWDGRITTRYSEKRI